MTRDRQGRLVCCHHFSRCVDRLEADGTITVIADRYRGLRFNRPNDVVVRSDGSIYFTDPPPRLPLTPPDHFPEIDIAGVYRVSADLSRVNMILRNFVNPNGLCFSPDEKILYVNDSNARRKLIMAYDIEENGFADLGTERLFCDMRASNDFRAMDGRLDGCRNSTSSSWRVPASFGSHDQSGSLHRARAVAGGSPAPSKSARARPAPCPVLLLMEGVAIAPR